MEIIYNIAAISWIVIVGLGVLFGIVTGAVEAIQKPTKEEETVSLKEYEELQNEHARKCDDYANLTADFEELEAENENLTVSYEALEAQNADLKETNDAYWRQLSGFIQRHPDEVETIDEDEINNPDDYKYVVR